MLLGGCYGTRVVAKVLLGGCYGTWGGCQGFARVLWVVARVLLGSCYGTRGGC